MLKKLFQEQWGFFFLDIYRNYLYKPLQDDTTTYFTFDTIERDFFVIFNQASNYRNSNK